MSVTNNHLSAQDLWKPVIGSECAPHNALFVVWGF